MSETDQRFTRLCRAPTQDLETLFQESRAPEMDSVVGWTFRGWNPPWFCRLIGISKFMKGFFRGESGVEGYNIPIRQNAFEEEWVPKPSVDHPKRFGFYLVSECKPESGRPHPDSLLLDYGASSRNFILDPSRKLRDFLVQIEPDLLLGKAYLQLPAVRVPVSFFLLERHVRSDWEPS
ncbi:MAG: hypothetical protein QF752_00910 [Planctomycetota bacterium]|nr:hypothetical protein [Planctomycetota bacterium]